MFWSYLTRGQTITLQRMNILTANREVSKGMFAQQN
jgi:hypothetical protein